jgi:hypothetical protein
MRVELVCRAQRTVSFARMTRFVIPDARGATDPESIFEVFERQNGSWPLDRARAASKDERNG